MSRLSERMAQLAHVVGLLVALAWGTSKFEEVDAWWHLREGQHVLDTWSLVGTDPWASFADRPYVATQWLPEAVAAWVVDAFGAGGLVWLRTLAIVTLYSMVYLLCRLGAGRLPSSVGATLVILGSGGGLNPRPQLVSFVLFTLVYAAWTRTMRDGRLRWWLVPVFWFWGCSHPLWMFGLLLGWVLSAFLLRRPGPARPSIRRLALFHAACLAALAVTPIGPRLLAIPLDVAGNASWIALEWRPTPLNNVFAVTTVAMLVLTALLWVTRPGSRPLWNYAVIAMALGMSLWMWRLVPLGCILGAPLFASAVQERLGRRAEPRGRREVAVAGLAAAVTVLLAVGLAAGPKGDTAQTYPGRVKAISAHLGTLPPGTVVLNDFGVSGWLLWQHPDLKPVVDLRVEIYAADYLRSYIRAERVRPGWQDYVRDSGATTALLEVTSPLNDALQHRAGWTVLAQEGRLVLLEAPTS